MILGTKARYAVMAMVDLAVTSTGRPVCLSDISTRQEIPLAYLEQIFNKLRKNGLVKSVRGPGGGYLLTGSQSETKILDIVTAVDESLQMTRCDKHTETGCMSSRVRCLTHDLWDGLGNQINQYLGSVSLEDVCNRKLGHNHRAGLYDFITEKQPLVAAQ